MSTEFLKTRFESHFVSCELYFRYSLHSCSQQSTSDLENHQRSAAELQMEPANPTEEGLASLNTVLLRDEPCLIRAAMLYYTVTKAADLSFCELFEELGRYIQDPETKWDYCLRAKRGYSDTSKPGKILWTLTQPL